MASVEAHEVRLNQTDEDVTELQNDVKVLDETVRDIQRQLRDAKIVLAVVGAIAVVSGGFITFAYGKVIEARAAQKQLIAEIKATGESERRSLAVTVQTVANTHVQQALKHQLATYDKRIAAASRGPATLHRMTRPQPIPADRDVILTFDEPVYSTDGGTTSSAEGWQFVAPRAGVYHVSVTLALRELNHGAGGVTLRKNGIPYAGLGGFVNFHGQQYLLPIVGASDVDLKAGDRISLTFSHRMEGSGTRYVGDTPSQNFVAVHFVRDL